MVFGKLRRRRCDRVDRQTFPVKLSWQTSCRQVESTAHVAARVARNRETSRKRRGFSFRRYSARARIAGSKSIDLAEIAGKFFNAESRRHSHPDFAATLNMWQGIVGQDAVVEQFRRRLASGRVTGTFLFVGPPGVGKRTFSLKLAQALLCQEGTNRSLDPCGECEDCRLTEAGNHPDLITVAKPADKSEIPLSLLIGPPENRMRQGLCHDIGLKPFRGGRRIAVIDDADELNVEGANALLKTLEEPPPRSVIILLSNGTDRQLPTIRSRSQLVRFAPLETNDLARLMAELDIAKLQDAERIALIAEGSLERARQLADPEVLEFRRELFSLPLVEVGQSQALAKLLLAFTEAAGKEASARRDRLRLAIGFMAEYFRAVTRAVAGADVGPDPTLQRAGAAAMRQPGLDLELLADMTQRTLEAIEHVDRNGHQTMIVEALADDLARRAAGRLASA